MNSAVDAFAALAQETRLSTFRMLVQYGPDGVSAGALAAALAVPHNTLSFHLAQLQQTGLVSSRRRGRHVIYAANVALAQDLARFLMEDCCLRRPQEARNCGDLTGEGEAPCR